MEGRATVMVSQLFLVIQKRVNIEFLAAKEVKAIDTFFLFLASETNLTVLRTLNLLMRLVRGWSARACWYHSRYWVL